ncbi:MAG: pseudouridine synthase [Fibrobacterota bacterium]
MASPFRPDAVSLGRVLSKLGYCSRTQALTYILDGKVSVNGVVVRDPSARVNPRNDRLAVDGAAVKPADKIYIMLNKPRGLVTTRADEKGRPTVFECIKDSGRARLAPVGRLDQASEGLLLFTNDTRWADRLLSPKTHLDKTYHVHVDRLPDDALLERMRKGVHQGNDTLSVKRVETLRRGEKNAWLEIALDEGKNRQIRRLMEVLQINVLQLIRVAIGPLALGNLLKGKWRKLTEDEVRRLTPPSARPNRAPKWTSSRPRWSGTDRGSGRGPAAG